MSQCDLPGSPVPLRCGPGPPLWSSLTPNPPLSTYSSYWAVVWALFAFMIQKPRRISVKLTSMRTCPGETMATPYTPFYSGTKFPAYSAPQMSTPDSPLLGRPQFQICPPPRTLCPTLVEEGPIGLGHSRPHEGDPGAHPYSGASHCVLQDSVSGLQPQRGFLCVFSSSCCSTTEPDLPAGHGPGRQQGSISGPWPAAAVGHKVYEAAGTY